MFNILPDDVLLLISYYFNTVKYVNNLSSINTDLYNRCDDLFYLNWGNNMYTKDFWDKASKRSKFIIKPYISMKNELVRIEIFQNTLKRKNMQKWDKHDFYTYWNNLEEILTKKQIQYNNTSFDKLFEILNIM
jgi:hypothetical protein